MKIKIGDVFYIKWESENKKILYLEGVVRVKDTSLITVIDRFRGDWESLELLFDITGKNNGGSITIKYPNENPEYFI